MPASSSNFKGRIGTTVAESEPHWPTAQDRAPGSPHILLVMFDDTGWSDFGCFGSEIATPTIDALARDGLRYSNFHVTPLCSPTRACVLTGRNHHAIGMRFLADTDTGFPNSRGRIAADVPTMPDLLRQQGYGTYLVGKWHLTPQHEITPAGPHRDWPLGRGFDKFYGFLGGVTDHYAPELVQDNQQVQPPATQGYHLSVDLVDRALQFLGDHATYTAERPFFLQLAFGATHAPFQAPRELITPYVPVFAKGWDQTRADRLKRQKALGLLAVDTELAERNPGVSAWDSLGSDAKLLYTHLQSAYAGFLEHADQQLGRLMQGLEALGLRDDTLVIVMSDNGASREGGQHGSVDINGPYSGHRPSVAEQMGMLDLIGGPDGPAHYPEGWAMAGNTPFRRYKQLVDLGGVRSPLVVSWPKGIAARGEVRDQFVHAIDIAPTVLALVADAQAGDELADGTSNGQAFAASAFDGKSFAPTLAAASTAAARDTQYWETLGHRAIWHQGWKAVTEHVPGTPFDADRWRLYDTRSDFSEICDLAVDRPDKLAELQALWWQEARCHGVLPLDDRSLVELIQLRTPLGLHNRRRLVLRPGQSAVPFATRVTGSNRSFQVTVQLRDRLAHHEGVLVASGSSVGGYSCYVYAGHLHFEHVCLGQRVTCSADVQTPLGSGAVGFRLLRGDGRTARVELLHADTVVGRADVDHTSGHLSFFGLSVCADTVSQVSQRYAGDFNFPHDAVDVVVIDFLDVTPSAADAADEAATNLATE
jgi:arylsulfatase A-like enzyme